ncbi:helix-turn-helix domain-containing protein [Nocardia abscessus]|uniref:helix-turn-helix domain-containing protein n=1 Tax=Nocardia abscessus TaxID=120957 RepID=UPI00031C8E48|nr:helix-turn-helix transcriptional regulator [Nocardia abscessus]MCC3328279.1 helix-turn-helix domain-containing protein [Nocardia abscessus]
MGTPRETPIPGQGSRFGAVSGFLLKLLREAAQLTQADFAERLGVDISTVHGWESGRRPLAHLRAGDLTRIRMLLTRHGAPSQAIMLLTDALEADLVIGDTVGIEPHTINADAHPLAVSIHQRTLANLITWPITGRPPVQLAGLTGRRGRGPRPSSPVISTIDRERFFDHLLLVADRCRWPDEALLRRQAIFLLGFDNRGDSADWLAGELTHALHTVSHTDVPGWLRVRSSAIALSATGDRDPLRAYLTRLRDNPDQQLANLTYYAYWVGDLGDIVFTDDAAMIRADPRTWSGERLLRHLLDRLQPGAKQADLYAHTLADLIASHPHLLAAHPTLRAATHTAIDRMSSDTDLMPQTRQDLANVAYAVRLSSR